MNVSRSSITRAIALLVSIALMASGPLAPIAWAHQSADSGSDAAPKSSAAQLDKIVERVALYPDPLLAQVLAAASFPDQIPGASAWASKNKSLKGDALVDAMSKAQLPYDPSIQALIPFPTVLDMMNKDLDWTAQLGNAVLAQRGDVMDAVQRMRKKAYDYGNLKSGEQMKVTAAGSPQVIEIQSPSPQVVYVPVYTPSVVYAPAPPLPPPPPPGAAFFFGLFGFLTAVAITSAFADSCWGWHCGFGWSSHTVIIHNTTWGRTWVNRGVYVHTWGGYNRGFYSRPYAYVNRPIQVNINNVNINRNINYRGNNNININRPNNGNINVNRPNVNLPNNRPKIDIGNAPRPAAPRPTVQTPRPNRGYDAPRPPAGTFSGAKNGVRTQAAQNRGKAIQKPTKASK